MRTDQDRAAAIVAEVVVGGSRVTVLGPCQTRGAMSAALRPAAHDALLLFPLGGPMLRVDAAGRSATPVAAAWASASSLDRFVASGEARLVVVTLPEASVREYGDPAAFAAPQAGGLLQPVRAFLLELARSARSLDSMSEYFLERLLWEMAASLILQAKSAGPVAPQPRKLREQAQAHIAAYRADPTLTPASVARSMNISLRQLQRAFAAAHSSPFAEIRQQRAAHARTMLADPDFRLLGIAEIARHAGFRDAAQLRRAFQMLGFPSPRSLRAGRPSGAASGPPLLAVVGE